MKKNTSEKNHYSLTVTFSLFVIILVSFAVFMFIDRNEEKNSIQKKIVEVGYSNLETINPLFLEKVNNESDKTTVNLELTSEIKRVYNIDVIYGEDAKLLAESVDAENLYNSESINKILLELINCLEKYPNNIFKEIQIKDYDVEICIVDYFNGDNVALATRDSNNNFKIYLSNSKDDKLVKKSVHHEVYHILEYYMKLEYDINKLYADWNKYNPDGFKYEEDITLLNPLNVYGIDNINTPYFVSIYSKASDKEDRAEVFADTMLADKKPSYYDDKIGAIKNKMVLISNAINSSFYSVNYGTYIYWTRFI